MGYSLPDDDLEVIHLLRRGLEGCDPAGITVVTKDPDPAMCRRYRSLFGPKIDWWSDGFDAWMARGGPDLGPSIGRGSTADATQGIPARQLDGLEARGAAVE